MDPNATLDGIRKALSAAGTADFESRLYELAELVEALDDWLTVGGFLPNQWADIKDQHNA